MEWIRMQEATWLAALRLPLRLRLRWMHAHAHQGGVTRDLRGALASLDDVAAHRRWVAQLLIQCRAANVRVIRAVDPSYPRILLRLHDPPLALFVRGDIRLLRSPRGVGIIGARRGTARGRRVAEAFGAQLGRAGLTIVSGLALGVDAAAHVGCLDAGGKAIAVLGTGPDAVHPPSHRRLHERVARSGLLVSEYPPGTPALPHHFIARNRILAALCRALVVVEAAQRSGALSTVEFAHQLGTVEVMAVPGPVDCPQAVGTLQLLREGAELVRSGEDVLDSLNIEAPSAAAAGPLGLGLAAESPAQIAARLAWPIDRVLAALGEAEVLGQVRRGPGDRWSVPSAPRRSGLRPERGGD